MDATSTPQSNDIDKKALPECIVFPARKEHTATVIISHGLGDTAKNFGRFLRELKDHSDLGHVKFILPSAPVMSVTGMQGRVMPSWADVYSFDYINRQEDEDGLMRAVSWIKHLIRIEETEHNIPSKRIIIGGLSQGGSISILTAITTEKPLGGLFALSTYVPLRRKILTPHAKNIPILWCHGTGDQLVSIDDWKQLAQTLAQQLSVPFITSDYPNDFPAMDQDTSFKNDDDMQNDGGRLHFRSYEGMGHTIVNEELVEVAAWISRRIPGEPGPSKAGCLLC
ncbi:Acyl-protein thioesterase 1 [Psilocybe cubensis]|uniref:Acyl-protein thioesterase 1 n=2 Tax=Psilocybe cubensis TaxID=181762 RepID=A0ACB8GPD4_PSICU|nr:Acyl-protein thioesterase 1 [Psilocybe cubensis]KAH9476899.1 Acyl-protein thioesterase 1 [Psilocybe cubensis]